MTHTKDEALKLALDALEDMHIVDFSLENLAGWNKAITAIKQSLAAPVQEPVAWMHTMIEDVVVGHRPADLNVHPDRWMPLYKDPTPCQTCEALARTVMMDQTAHDTTPPAQPAPVQPVQGQVLGFDVVLNESLPPNTMKFVQPAPTVQEPVAKKTGIGLVTGNGWDSLPVGTLLYTTPPAAPTAQEPVAWFKHGPYEDGEQLAVVFKNPHDDICYSPLGFIDSPPAAQRQWVGLTDNEKIDCASPYDSRLCCVEATEAKLKEKNQ
jgi:hypothetical protein